jgi:hypothetical protein
MAMEIASEQFRKLVADVTAELAPMINEPTFGLAFIGERVDRLPAATRVLLLAINETPALAVFRTGWIEFAGVGHLVQPQQLIGWLVKRTGKTSAEQAVADMLHYLDATELPVQRRTLISGATAASEFTFGSPDTSFIPRGNLPGDNDPVLEEEWGAALNMRQFVWPGGLIETRLRVPKRHLAEPPAPPETGHPAPAGWSHSNELMALQLTVAGVSPLVAWTRPPDWCPFLHMGSRAVYFKPGWSVERALTGAEIAELPMLLGRLRALDANTYSAIALAVQRLSTAVTQRSVVDRAVDLRIAYEVTFSIGDTDDRDKRGELRFRLAQRAAHYLGGLPNLWL